MGGMMSKPLSHALHNVSTLKSLLFLLLVPLIILPVYAQVTPTPEERTTIEGIPSEKITCDFRLERGVPTDECLPNRRIIIYAIYDTTVKDRGTELETTLNSHKTAEKPLVQELPLRKEIVDDVGKYESVLTSFEYGNKQNAKLVTLRAEILGKGLATDAAYVRITEFNTWHHFADEFQKPCELTNVIEFGDPSVID